MMQYLQLHSSRSLAVHQILRRAELKPSVNPRPHTSPNAADKQHPFPISLRQAALLKALQPLLLGLHAQETSVCPPKRNSQYTTRPYGYQLLHLSCQLLQGCLKSRFMTHVLSCAFAACTPRGPCDCTSCICANLLGPVRTSVKIRLCCREPQLLQSPLRVWSAGWCDKLPG